MAYDLHYEVAEDGGNGFQKTYVNGEEFLYPSLISDKHVASKLSQSSQVYDSTKTSAVDQFFNGELFKSHMDTFVQSEGLAKKKEKEGRFLSGLAATDTTDYVESYTVTTRTQKVNSDISFVCLLSLIAYCSARDSWNKNQIFPENIKVRVDRFFTALPLNEFKINGVSEEFRSRFADHTHTVVLENFDKPITVTIDFGYVNVMPEGLPASQALTYDPENPRYYRNDDIFSQIYFDPDTLDDPEHPPVVDGATIRKSNILIIDIGDGSTDCVIVKGTDNKLQQSKGLEQGIGSATQRAIDYLDEQRINIKGSRQHFYHVAMTSKSRAGRVAHVELKKRLDDYFASLDKMVNELINNYQDPIDYVIVTGGGSVVLAENHLEDFVNAVKEASGILGTPVLIVPAKYSQKLNLQGLKIMLYRARQAHLGDWNETDQTSPSETENEEN